MQKKLLKSILFTLLTKYCLAVHHDQYTCFDTSKLSNDSFLEQFDYEDLSQAGWFVSKSSKSDGSEYDGEWMLAEPVTYPGFVGDKGLLKTGVARHHAISKKLETPFDNTNKSLVLQYEVKPQNELICSGAYIKLLSGSLENEFSDESPYEVMFGPDQCGENSQVHFIFRRQSPITGYIEEKKLLRPPLARSNQLSTLYTLILHQDGDFQIRINGKCARSGNLHDDNEFDPPLNPPKFILDISAEMPDDWDDREYIPDPEVTEPPTSFVEKHGSPTIPDPNISKPEDWDETAPLFIPDPEASIPEEWDVEEDGEWEPPLVPNPKCLDGKCGPWNHPHIPNKDYKVWQRPLIENPNYKGKWIPPLIENPNYYEDENPANFNLINGIGFELWGMDDNILFDNIYLGHSVNEAEIIGNSTFEPKLNIEYEDMEENHPRAKLEPGPPPPSFDELLEAQSSDHLTDLKDFFYNKTNQAFDIYNGFLSNPLETITTYPIEFALYCIAFVFLFTFAFGILSVLIFILSGGLFNQEPVPRQEIIKSKKISSLQPETSETNVTTSGIQTKSNSELKKR